jgi:phosphoribosylformimino-5-aminoimidazole carboxamide ribotide isomerase
MYIIPAIDIKDGLCVRLYQGDFEQATVYDRDPVAVAQRWVEQGATRLHIVDLDGAKQGQPANIYAVKEILHSVSIPIEFGGGLRTEQDVDTILSSGAAYAILGTVAVRNPQLVERLIRRYGNRIIVGIDARDGYVATDGWTEVEQVQAIELVKDMAHLGVEQIIYTDIARDGTLTEPNYAATEALVRLDGPAIIASGGISHQQHLMQLASIGVYGAIIGRALYTGAINLPAAIQALEG